MTDTNRRDLFKGAAVTGLAAAAAPAFAQGAAPLADPQTRFVSTPFPEQRQKWPALQRDMRPVPDCGEASYRGSGRLAGRKALVTGGDSGIGRAAVIAFSREGADVAINYYPTEEPDAQDVAKLLRAEGRKVVLIPGDLTDAKFCTDLIARANRELGGLDILVNNAAYQQSKESIAEISFEQFDRTMKTNVYAMFHLCKAAIPLMKPGASIINTASVNSVSPEKELLDYASTKGAILIFTKALAKQLAKQGIRVNAVGPGPIWTPLQVAGGQLPGKMGEFGQDTPIGRAGQPAELAGLYVALADPNDSYTTGSFFGANGGTGAS
ncbi:NAD(P)-dependent dehydrogenase (short-subunit alcohol dehydrogenase family) [Sphingomonas sp. PP-CE-3A-406]|uniref:SDR family oxidoreductase n=1 Tax=Sphingomonas sp. PP-CE-3A-406 TaxID=2135659 RepID=UPI000EF9EE00|nr:SDR family oxidoreductase [Sphingomonas sp. PP-CE-3A-406]RMB54451.1 NAD(P)-dependent dehydrogenase (short-subunit alcohol dehydrogenase family) [Sphingomonas sp. PP-CE-3A-406]